MINTFEKVNNVKVPYKIKERRQGDIGSCYANPALANKDLNWRATKTLEDMCKSSYDFTKNRKNKD